MAHPNDLIVLTASTIPESHPESRTMATYLAQLADAAIDYHVEPMREFPANGGSLGFKIEGMRRTISRFANYERIIFTDAHDVQFFGTREEVIAKLPLHSGVLLAAERNCYPEPQLADCIRSFTPWAYANGGMLAGTPASFMAWFQFIECHPKYDPNMLDQAWFNRRLAEGDPLVRIDYATILFYCMWGEGGAIADLQWEDGHPINMFCHTLPNFLHANGHWASDHIYARRNS